MKNKLKYIILICSFIILIVIVIVSFCNSNRNNISKSETVAKNFFSNGLVTERGFYHNKANESNGEVLFYDFNSKKTVYLCNRPNCDHVDPEDCSAYIRGIKSIFEIENELYQVIFNGYNLEVYKTKIDNSEKIKIGDIDSEYGSITSSFVIKDRYIYFPYLKREFGENDKNIHEVIQNISIAKFDLNTGKTTVLFNPKKCKEGYIYLYGIIENKLFYADVIYETKAKSSLSYIDLDTDKITTVISEDSNYVASSVGKSIDDFLYYYNDYNSSLYCINSKTLENQLVFEMPQNGVVKKIIDNKLEYQVFELKENENGLQEIDLLTLNNCYFDLDTSQKYIVHPVSNDTEIRVENETNNEFIARVYKNNTPIEWIAINKQDYYNENFQKGNNFL